MTFSPCIDISWNFQVFQIVQVAGQPDINYSYMPFD